MSDIPTEKDEAYILADYLRSKGLLFTHIANERKGSYKATAALKKQGMSKGVPDYMIFNHCTAFIDPNYVRFNGIAIELKRKKGGRVSPEQRAWLQKLELHGWYAFVANGADEAIQKLGSLIIEDVDYESLL